MSRLAVRLTRTLSNENDQIISAMLRLLRNDYRGTYPYLWIYGAHSYRVNRRRRGDLGAGVDDFIIIPEDANTTLHYQCFRSVFGPYGVHTVMPILEREMEVNALNAEGWNR